MISRIHFWKTQSDEEGHGLLRIWNSMISEDVTIIFSDLKSNNDGPHLLGHFGEYIQSVEREFPDLVKGASISWYVHRGAFSSHEGVPGEVLLNVDIESIQESQIADAVLVREHEMTDELGDIKLDPMRSILQKLDWELVDYMNDPKW
ncbi:hypothetical protein [Flavivirga jejuensis]|uniref:Uncharacterized protein n=1 Tax=Flavivirga jejuensis TaxID=870487 RepID=A0ABT8WSM1_9FLAO|nr:hypothetical protein [Flavivirga jejuensis]MDO5976109.1 hypothetical protein [Flavivirga jejuensis]